MRRLGLAVAAAALAVTVTLPGARVPFYNTPEPQEALVVWEMVRTGDWILPRRNGEEIPSKPPLFHWLAASMSLAAGGVSELTVRLPSVLAAALTVALVFHVAAVEWGLVAGAAAALVLATSPEWARWAVTARTDAVFAFFVTASFVLAERWMRNPAGSRLTLLAAAAGAAMLAKGPAGALLPALGIAVERRGWSAVRAMRPRALLASAAVFVVIAGSWYAAAIAHGGFEFFQKQILLENVFRFLPDEGGPSREHSFFFYFPALFLGPFPWSLLLPFAIASRLREARHEPFTRHLLVWILVVFAVCSAASGKRTNYILPLYPAAALLVGAHAARVFTARSAANERALRWIAAATAVLLTLVAALLVAWRAGLEPWLPVLPFLHVRDRPLVPFVAATIGRPSAVVVASSLALAGSLIAALVRRRLRVAMAIFGATMLLATLAGSAVVRPVEARLKTFEPFARRVAERVDPTARLRFFRKPHYGVLFYLGRHVPVERRFGRLRPGWALVWEDDWQRLSDGAKSAATIEEASPPAARHRPDSRLLLVRLDRKRDEALAAVPPGERTPE